MSALPVVALALANLFLGMSIGFASRQREVNILKRQLEIYRDAWRASLSRKEI
jgi:hypothetical protein